MLFILKDCGAENEIRPKEPLRCKECGHRIMYKQRTKKSKSLFFTSIFDLLFYILLLIWLVFDKVVQFEARWQ